MRSLRRAAFIFGVGRTLAILPRSRRYPTVSADPEQVRAAAMQRVLARYGIEYSSSMMWGDLPSPEVLRAVVKARQEGAGTPVAFPDEISEEEARVRTDLEDMQRIALKGRTVGVVATVVLTLASIVLIVLDQSVAGVVLYVVTLTGLVASAVYGEITYVQRLEEQDFSLLD